MPQQYIIFTSVIVRQDPIPLYKTNLCLVYSASFRVIISDVVDYESVDKDDGVGTKKDAASASQGTSATGSGGVNKKEVGSHSSEPSLLNGDKKDREKESATGAHDSVGGQLSDLSSSAATPHGQPKDNGKPAPLKNGLCK